VKVTEQTAFGKMQAPPNVKQCLMSKQILVNMVATKNDEFGAEWQRD